MHVLRHVRRAAVAAAVATALVASAAPSAHAEATDLPLAIAETELARSFAVADAVEYNTQDSEVTCANPTVSGSVVVPPVYRPGTAAVWGKDQAEGEGHCASLQGAKYDVTLTVVIEWRQGANLWTEVPGCRASVTQPAADGHAAVVVPPFLCSYDPASLAAGRPHRVSGHLTHSLTDKVYRGYSAVYLSPQQDDVVSGTGT